MIYLNPENDNIKEAAEYHYKFIRYVIKKKLHGSEFNEKKPDSRINRINKKKEIPENIKKFLDNDENLKTILIGKPEDLTKIKNKFNISKDRHFINLLLNYDSWVNKENFYEYYNAYSLAKSLETNTCVYCNRMYTKTVVNPHNLTRPEFDHWFPQSKFPLLALSFFNLIPCCHICNSTLKRDKVINFVDHLHPYIDNEKTINEEIKFSYYNKTTDSYEFKMITNFLKGENTVNLFKIKEIYETHEDEIKELRRIRDVYSESYLLKLSKIYNLNISEEEIYRLAFGVYIEVSKFEKRPLSKMKKDILIELGIIKPNEND